MHRNGSRISIRIEARRLQQCRHIGAIGTGNGGLQRRATDVGIASQHEGTSPRPGASANGQACFERRVGSRPSCR
jgi:hypothetical protein